MIQTRFRAFAPIVALCMPILAGGCGPSQPPPVPSDPALLEKAVQAYLTGLAASDAADVKHAEPRFLEASKLAPGEAAIWANLALQSLRASRTDEAVERIAKARALQPKDTDILALSGIAASRKGLADEALRYFAEAAQSEPGNVRALYSAVQEHDRSGKPDVAERKFALLMDILKAQPENLAATLEATHLGLELGRKDHLAGAFALYDRLAPRWIERDQGALAELKTASAESDPEAAKVAAYALRNLLKPNPVYRFTYDELQLPPGEVYPTLHKAFVFKLPPSTPAPEDEAIRFEGKEAFSANGVFFFGVYHATAESPPVQVIGTGQGAAVAGLKLRVPTNGACEADLSYDWRNDLVLYGDAGFRVLVGSADGSLKETTASWKLSPALMSAPIAFVLPIDIESDSDLDLVVCPKAGSPWVFRNNGDMTAAVEKLFEGCPAAASAAWADFDADGDQDVAFIGSKGGLYPYRNERGGRFVAFDAGEEARGAVALVAADVDRNGVMDFAVLRSDGSVIRWSAEEKTPESAIVYQLGPGTGLALAPGASRLFAEDLDLNGGTDLVVSYRLETTALLAKPDGSYRAPLKLVDWPVTDIADLDGDGRLDLVGTAMGSPMKALGKGSMPYRSQRIGQFARKQDGDSRLNTFLIGGEIDARSGRLDQLTPIRRPVTLLGLGENSQTNYTRMRLPDGCYQTEFDLALDKAVKVEQRLKGSCPWLFAWNGRSVEFVTDFIWRSPLGLKINAQGTADVADTFDRVLVRGDQLAPKDGYYDLRITADLWETHFFDLVRLVAVDHPEETEVYVDERFAFPPPSLRAWVTKPVRPVSAAFDDKGSDVSDVVGRRDGQYLDTFGRGKYQGVTRPHYVEVDLGSEAPASEHLLLAASGWIHPTDSSINVAIGQGSSPTPVPLSAEVPDGKGGWRVLHANLGFPSGKSKTILVPLKGAFAAGGPRRVRLKTNLEIYWDFIGWTEELPNAPRKETAVDAAESELRYRGFSEVNQANQSSPELPDYSRLSGANRPWRDLIGFYTRFGDVRELTAKVDDRYVIMNAGDELRLRFRELPPPAKGWKRDYILEGDGWVKDGNVNTSYSKTVLPLPYHADRAYKGPAGELEDDPVYRRRPSDWRSYHTRYVGPELARSRRRP